MQKIRFLTYPANWTNRANIIFKDRASPLDSLKNREKLESKISKLASQFLKVPHTTPVSGIH